MKRVLLVAATTGYQVHEFGEAARSLGVELVLATDRCHILPDPWGDNAAPVRFEDPEPGIDALVARGPFDGILAVGDRPACVAAQAAERLGVRYHSPEAANIAGNKLLTRDRFRAAGMLVPAFQRVVPGVAPRRYPCVVKPLDGSASRGVIRADDADEFAAATERISRMGFSKLLVEDFIPGREFALEGVVTRGDLTTLAIFDKPDPLDGPFFEESIYVTPSSESELIQASIRQAAQEAVTAIGLTDGPVHAEMRVNDQGVWMLEVGARPIGGLCARVLRFAPSMGLEELLLRHALGENMTDARLLPGAHGVMMIPIPGAGIYQGVKGLEEARKVPGIEDIIITAKPGQVLVPLPEGSSYLGFIFSRGDDLSTVSSTLRQSHLSLKFHFSATLTVVE